MYIAKQKFVFFFTESVEPKDLDSNMCGSI